MDSTERRLADAKLGAAIDDAVQQLPDGYAVDISIDRNGATVQAWNEYQGRGWKTGTKVSYTDQDRVCALSERIREAVAWALNGGEE